MPVLKQMKADCLNVQVFDTRDAMGCAAGECACATIRELLEKKDYVHVIFAAAPSQSEMLKTMITAKDIDWSRVYAFHMDEYIGLDSNAPQGFGNFLARHIFSILPFTKVFRIDAEAKDAVAECCRYSELLRRYPVDLVCLGIGENGHIAFNDPGVADFNDPALVKVVELDDVCRMQQVHDGCFTSINEVPTHALTLTIPALAAAAYMVCTVPAASKKDAVWKTVCGPITQDVPATILRQHPHAELFCDSDSGASLLYGNL